MEPKAIERRIEKALPGARVRVQGADQHYSAVIVSAAFEGKSRVEQHRMIYDLFRVEMADQSIHALSLTTRTPAEWERENAQKG